MIMNIIAFEMLALIIGMPICCRNKEGNKAIGRLLGLFVAVIIPLSLIWVAMMGECIISLMKAGVI